MQDVAYRYETKKWKDDLKDFKGMAKKPVPYQTGERGSSPRDHLNTYLKEIGRYKLLSREEEAELARRVRESNDEQAVDQLIKSNLRLVVKIAKDYNRHWNRNQLDLIQEGNLGLLQAVRKFDPDRGIKFSYYASFWIKAFMLKHIMDNRKLVKIGTTQNQRKLFFRMAKEKNELKAKGLDPDPKLVAKRLDVKEEEVIEMTQRLRGSELSLDMPVSDHSNETYEALLEAPTRSVDERLSEEQRRVVFAEKLKQFRERLTKREADIFDNRIMSDRPLILQELGDRYQISRERVRQIENIIIENIKAWSKAEISNFEEDYYDLVS